MKICLFNVTSTMDAIGTGEVGGVEAYTFRLGEALQRRGHDVTLFGGEPKPGRPRPATPLRLEMSPYWETAAIPDLGTRFQRLIQRLHFAHGARRKFLAGGWDAVLIFKPYDLLTARFWRRAGWRGRIVASLHGPEFYAGDRWFVGAVDALYAVSASTARPVEVRYGRPCPVIPNFIAMPPLFEEGAPPSERLVLAVGRLVGCKGYAPLLRAFARAAAAWPPARLVFVGDGPERAALEAEASRLGVLEKTTFTGVVGPVELEALRRRAWLFVQPSTGYESFSIATLEALAAGVNTLVSDQVGIVEWFHGEDALLVCPARDEEALAAELTRRLAEPWSVGRARGRLARAIAQRYFDEVLVVPQVEALCAGGREPIC